MRRCSRGGASTAPARGPSGSRPGRPAGLSARQAPRGASPVLAAAGARSRAGLGWRGSMRPMPTSVCVTLAATVLAAAPIEAQAASGPPDPDAPAGASGQWLPDEEWVMQRWTPFDETRLYDLLGTTRPGVERWLADA